MKYHPYRDLLPPSQKVRLDPLLHAHGRIVSPITFDPEGARLALPVD